MYTHPDAAFAYHERLKQKLNTDMIIGNQLNDLIQITRDRIKGYEKAIEEVGNDITVAGIFRQNAMEGRKHLTDLTQLTTDMGVEPAKEGTAFGSLHRMWMDVKNTFSSHEKQTAVGDCAYIEKATKEAYDQVLNDSREFQIPSYVREVLNQQRRDIERALDHMQGLEKAYEQVNS